ncbi:MAG: helix-turn-helix domain-containing protein [Nocardioidaceae bacterium]|nr:helix-turn-helix domain-containing protein [Nocardioidaceae bacterium]
MSGPDHSWLGTLRHLVHDLQEAQELAMPHAVVKHLQGLVATKLIYGQPSNYAEMLTSLGRRQVHPRRIQRVVDHIHEHPRTPHTSTELARVSGVSLWSLQEAFREHVGTSLVAYMRSVRLAGAHEELTAADPADGATVASVAHSWGFGHVSRFADHYRRRYGESPSTTLHR